ncbi:hypothetical protein [Oceanobacillus sp. CFH 90083]|uniref:hypothetical protein n=1 Tax=Oceanobacillus sp. CFH 90083 TaxID=2592336 RepID=UPI00128D6544|nr:hypothetical protein [Oceanobacillus sp. CFH 90083]
MMNNYEFECDGTTRFIEVDGEQQILVRFTAREPREMRESQENINLNGNVALPAMEFFQAGLDGNLSDVVRDTVLDKLTAREDDREQEEEEENAE